MTLEPDTVVGVDIGGTRIKTVVLGGDDRVLADVVAPTPADIATDFVAAVTSRVSAALDAAGLVDAQSVAGIGVVVPGVVDVEHGVGRWAANLGWRDLPVTDLLQRALVLPVALGHDVRAGLVSEHELGAARGSDDVLFLAIGTGIAGALMVGGRVHEAADWTGEVGHVSVDPGGAACACGGRGCLETVASARALGRAWSSHRGEQLSAADLAAAVESGEPAAIALWQNAVDAIASVAAPAIAAAGTELVLVGGGLVNSGETLLAPLRAALAARLPIGYPDVRAAALGDRAGALGAACILRSKLALDRP